MTDLLRVTPTATLRRAFGWVDDAVLRRTVILIPVFAAVTGILTLGVAYLGVDLGTLVPGDLIPLYAAFDPRVTGWTVVAALAMGTYILAVARLCTRIAEVGVGRVLATAWVGGLVLPLLVQLSDGPKASPPDYPGDAVVSPLVKPYTAVGHEYYWELQTVDRQGLPGYLDRYGTPEGSAERTLHGVTHPPGFVVVLWMAARLFGESIWVAVLATVFLGSLLPLTVFPLARAVLGSESGKLATLLTPLTPSYLLYTATSMDAVYAPVALAGSAAALWALRRRRLLLGVLGGVLLGLAAFMSYVTVVLLCVTAAVYLGTTGIPLRELPRRDAAVGAALLVGAVLVWSVPVLGFGYDPVSSLRLSLEANEAIMGPGERSLLGVLFLGVGNLSAFLLGCGLALVALLSLGSRRGEGPGRWSTAAAVLAVVAVFSFSTLFRMEVDRIWSFLVPFVIVAGTTRLLRDGAPLPSRVVTTCAILGSQALVLEVLAETVW